MHIVLFGLILLWLHYKFLMDLCNLSTHILLGCLTYLPLDKMATIFADNIFKCNFVDEKFCIYIRTSIIFLHNGSIDSKSALVQVMAWRQTGVKPLP